MKIASFKNGSGNKVFGNFKNDDWVFIGDLIGEKSIADVLMPEFKSELISKAAARGPVDPVELDWSKACAVADSNTTIWGAGLNYKKHAEDLDQEQPPIGPGSYLRPSGCLIDNGANIEIPTHSDRVTGEAELGLLIGTNCKNVKRENWRDVVVGVMTVLDMTAEDVIRVNPRYIPWAKGFDTFCSVGPMVTSLDEFETEELQELRVSTIRNGEVVETAQVSNMLYDLGFLVEYFSAGRTLKAGTVLCTGTPGAAEIKPGDKIEAVVEKVGSLSHSVV